MFGDLAKPRLTLTKNRLTDAKTEMSTVVAVEAVGSSKLLAYFITNGCI